MQHYKYTLNVSHPRVEEQIEVLVQQRLVLLVPHAELLQEQMREPNDLLHLHVVLQTGGKGRTAVSHAQLGSGRQ